MKIKTIKIFIYPLAVWMITSIIGSFTFLFGEIIGLGFLIVVALSLIASLPAAIFLLPAIIILESLTGIANKVIYSLAAVSILCAVVVVTFVVLSDGYAFDPGMRTQILLPYVISAYTSFFLVCHRLIFFESLKTVTNK